MDKLEIILKVSHGWWHFVTLEPTLLRLIKRCSITQVNKGSTRVNFIASEPQNCPIVYVGSGCWKIFSNWIVFLLSSCETLGSLFCAMALYVSHSTTAHRLDYCSYIVRLHIKYCDSSHFTLLLSKYFRKQLNFKYTLHSRAFYFLQNYFFLIKT